MPILACLADVSPAHPHLSASHPPLHSELAGLVCNMPVQKGFTTKQLMDCTIQ